MVSFQFAAATFYFASSFHNKLRVQIHICSFPDRLLKQANVVLIQYRGATLWNSLLIQARNQANLTSFKASLKA